MTGNAYVAYNNSVMHATGRKDRILLMLYDGALKFVRFARIGIEEKSPKIRGENISKVMSIITELDYALDREIKDPLTENLSSLYQYMIERLTVANINNDLHALDEAERILSELRDGFEKAIREECTSRPPIYRGIEESGAQRGFCLAI